MGELKDSDEHLHNAYFVLAASNPVQYTNDLRYLEEEETPRLMWEANNINGNVGQVENVILGNFFDLKRGDTMELKSRRKLEPAKESLVTYGCSYILAAGLLVTRAWKPDLVL